MPKPVIRTEPPLDTAFQRRMARGHELRLGHPLEAVQVTSDNQLWHRVNLCCGATVPAEVVTWAEEIAP